jgi:hypothetical protein
MFDNPLLRGKFAIEAAIINEESGDAFLVTADAYYRGKVAKKSPEKSKITKLLLGHGWKLDAGNDSFLIFKQPGYKAGELMVVRGTKAWYWDVEGLETIEGVGLNTLERALNDGTVGKPKAMAMHAANPAIKSNAPGDHHEEMTMGDALPEHKVGSEVSPDDAIRQIQIESNKQIQENQQAPLACPICGKASSGRWLRGNYTGMRDTRVGALVRHINKDHRSDKVGLMARPDYGTGFSAEMNEKNSNKFNITLEGGRRSKDATKKLTMYVSSVDFIRGNALKVAKFACSPNPAKAVKFAHRTAVSISSQLNGPDFRMKSNVTKA